MDSRVAVIGGGFYGCSVAIHLAQQGADVVLFERSPDLLTRASYHNQARLHNGYHYPRSFSTAYRSRLNFQRFLHEFRPAIVTEFVKLYAIARVGSKVSPRQFEVFCHNIEAPIRPARSCFLDLFSPRLISSVYETQEYAFDAAVLRRLLRERLAQAGVTVKLATAIAAVEVGTVNPLTVVDSNGNGAGVDYVFNCTYSGLNAIAGIAPSRLRLKHEIAEMPLVQLPDELREVSVTVMDGPFFSFMPFPNRGLSTFSHVRYTPQSAWTEAAPPNPNPYITLESLEKRSNFGFMVRDAQRYIPCLANMVYRDSLFELKTVLVKNENDDGRPILFEVDPAQSRIVSLLGSKIDNIYDALEAVDQYLSAA
ncbi:MAG: FAD-binding oxidoreductase [Oscillatoriales cyanobacterium C42_A2020_001]|nr:FAD-binding oxidoreductase [Leptolyngbyaceae cyanobacterium C42_A2020_001]